MIFKSKVKVTMIFSTKKAYNSAMLMVMTLKLSRDVGPHQQMILRAKVKVTRTLVLKSLITWQCLGLGPSNLEGMLVLTSR